MSATLIQHATGRHLALLELARPIHASFCARWGIEYRVRTDRRCPNNPYFDKYADLIEWCETAPAGAPAIWIDSDALWINPTVNIGEALAPGFDLGMTVGNTSFNTGVMCLRSSPALLAALQRIYAASAREVARGVWRDETAVWQELAGAHSEALVEPLDDAFNFCGAASLPLRPVVIHAWHGRPFHCRIEGMAAKVHGLKRALEVR
ncbi:MAG TPA: hypothetical protein VGP72_14750 [Planctomycetota bacterium]|jgi:hypothetical protein